jgi:hypothetical protein
MQVTFVRNRLLAELFSDKTGEIGWQIPRLGAILQRKSFCTNNRLFAIGCDCLCIAVSCFAVWTYSQTTVNLRPTRLWSGFGRELIWCKAVKAVTAWPYERHASGPSDRDAGDIGFLRKLSCRAAFGTDVGKVSGGVPLRSRILEEPTCRCRKTYRTVEGGT